jgi:hypothetical protein
MRKKYFGTCLPFGHQVMANGDRKNMTANIFSEGVEWGVKRWTVCESCMKVLSWQKED